MVGSLFAQSEQKSFLDKNYSGIAFILNQNSFHNPSDESFLLTNALPTIHFFKGIVDLSVGCLYMNNGIIDSTENLEIGMSLGVGMKLNTFKKTEDIIAYFGFRLSHAMVTEGVSLLKETTISPISGVDFRLNDHFSLGYELRLNYTRNIVQKIYYFDRVNFSNHVYFRFIR